MSRAKSEATGGVGHLCLIDIEITPDDREDQSLLVPFSIVLLEAPHEEHGLRRLPGLDVEELRQILDGPGVRRGDLLHRGQLAHRRLGAPRFGAVEFSNLPVGRI